MADRPAKKPEIEALGRAEAECLEDAEARALRREREAARHAHTEYDTLLVGGWDRHEARAEVRPKVDDKLGQWRPHADADAEAGLGAVLPLGLERGVALGLPAEGV